MTENATSTAWIIPGAEDQPIIGNTHRPRDRDPIGVILLVHGFLGYKDYGFFPYLARYAARQGFVAHRFNLSNSGMTNTIEKFTRLDLFEKSTWRKTVFDIDAVIDATQSGDLPGADLPCVLWGHSRGGVGVLLAAGHRFMDGREPLPAAVITVSAPAATCRMSDDQQEILMTQGYIQTQSGRTGQTLRIGRQWLDEQRSDPDWHDLEKATRAIDCPLLIVHGAQDPTVNPAEAGTIESFRDPAQSTRSLIVPGADHVFKTPNPFPADDAPGPELVAMRDAVLELAIQSVTR